VTDQGQPPQDQTLVERDPELGVDWTAIWEGLQKPAALRGLAVLGIGIVALAAPRLSAWLLSLLIGIALVLAGGVEGLTALRRRPLRWPELGRSLVLLVGGIVLLAMRTLGEGAVASLVGTVIGVRGLVDLYGTWRNRREADDVGWQVTRGLSQVLLGILIAVSHGGLLLFLIALLAIAWIVAGGVAVATALQREDDEPELSVADTGNAVLDWLHRRDMGADDRQAVVDKVVFEGDAAKGRISRFIVLMAFSTAIATFGINADSTAVVIGAMLIAPLMIPIMAASASLLMGWPARATRSLFLVAGGVAIAVAGSWMLSRYFPVLEITSNSQILSRVSPTTVDLMIAFAAGAAGAFAVSRPDVADSLPGVAIAVALVPPLTVIGITLEAGEWDFALGATLLFLTNLVGVILAAGVTFVLVGFSPWFHVEANRSQINRSFATVGVALLLIAIPLTVAGDEVLASVTNSGKASGVVEQWLETAPGYQTVSVTVRGGEAEVVVVGSGALPAPQTLADAFADEFSREMEVDLSVVPEDSYRLTGEP
jgi:uncharacterized hydrophobic protein (TIGR00271 family)